VGINVYCSDNSDTMPPLKWRGLSGSTANIQYTYEMFRQNTPDLTPPDFTSDGGPYNLGVLYFTGALQDGKVFYCPSNPNNPITDNLYFDYYAVKGPWPCGVDPVVAASSNPGYVRSGYQYYPESTKLTAVATSDSVTGTQVVPVWPLSTTSPEPYKDWICVPPFKQSAIDQTKSMIADVMFQGLTKLTHKTGGGNPAGVNAAFGDAHVAWQSIKSQPNTFDALNWASIAANASSQSVNDFMYTVSTFKP
jgi:hypothetical protein